MGIRFAVVFVFFAGVFGALMLRMYELQLTHGSYYLARASSQLMQNGFVEAPRGAIYVTDKNGNRLPVAVNKDYPLIFASPKLIEDPAEAAHQVASLLSLDAADVTARFSKKTSTYELLARRADPAVAEQVKALNVNGIVVDYSPARYYPLEQFASQLVGFVAPRREDNREAGRYGVEEFYDTALSGAGGSIVNGKITPPKPGADITLTIDSNVQIESERIISSLVEDHHAKGGSVIVQEPKTGKILAMASYPTFDPNIYAQAKLEDFVNPATQQIYEPGSVIKVITMAAGIDSGKITPDTTFYDPGFLKVNGRTIRNWDLKGHGTVTMTNVIEQSINTGAAFAQRQTGNAIFRDYLVKFGFADKTAVDLPGEVKGDLRNLLKNDAPAVAYATASFGQGIAMTPLTVINAFSALANGGVLMHPYINADVKPEVLRRVVSQNTASTVIKMMVSAVDKAKVAAVSGYSVAGKTGTAFIPDFKHGGYTTHVYNTYVGFAPATDPKFTILVRLNEPEGDPIAGTTVVPAFAQLTQFMLNYYSVPPDRISGGQ